MNNMPDAMHDALFGVSEPASAEVILEITNPWTSQPWKRGNAWVKAETAINYESDEAQEAKRRSPISEVFEAQQTETDGTDVSHVFKKALQIDANGEQDFFARLNADLQLLRYKEEITTPQQRTASDDWSEQVPSLKKHTLTYKTRRDEDGTLWREGYDATGELQSALVVYDETE